MDSIFDALNPGGNWLAWFVDFAVVYYVIYRCLLLIKGTRAVQVVGGIIAIIALFFISKNAFWTLPTTYWFIDKFFANFIIILVVVFQQDIRRALAQFGRTSNLFSSTGSEDTNVLEEIIQAASSLSEKKIGALIAIERNADLGHLIEDGVKLDAQVSKEMLFSVFLTDHGNPLHDGAVVISNGRIAAANVFLPLTNNPKVQKSLGTRHRAGIGLSEDTDAAVVIVSEESGTISVAHREELFRLIDAKELRDILQRIFLTEEEESILPSILEKFRSRRTVKGDT